MRRASISFGLLTVLFSLAGCMAETYRISRSPSREISKNDVAFLSSPGSTRNEVLEKLGVPYHEVSGEGVVIYYARWAREVSMIQGFEGILRDGNIFEYLLLIQFDDADHVIRFDSYKYPRKMLRKTIYDYDRIAKDWVSDPLPDYFMPAELPKGWSELNQSRY